MSLHPHHHHLDRSSAAKQPIRKSRKEGGRSDIDRLLDPSYASHSQSYLKRPSMEAATYIDSQGVAHDSAYNPFAGLDNVGGGGGGGRRHHTARQSSTDSEASFGGLQPLASAPMGRSRSGRSTASGMHGSAGGHRRNMPASEMSLRGYQGGGSTYGDSVSSPHLSRTNRAPSIASSGTQYPTTTTAASKSRRSTLLSQTTAYTDDITTPSDLKPPSANRFKSSYGSYNSKAAHNIPSPPSSIASSAAPQIYPETPAQREARRRSTERSRPLKLDYSSSVPVAPPLSAILPPRPRPFESAFSGSEHNDGSTGAGSHYVPTKWKEEKELKRGGVDEEFRPQEKEKEWTPGVGENVKRSLNEITLAVRFGMFRAKKKIERKATGRG